MLKWLSNLFIQWLTHEREVEGVPLCDFERVRYELRAGDVLLIEGRSRVSDIIKSITQSSWSHAALYIGRIHDIEDPKIRNLVSIHFAGSPDTQLLIEGIMGKGTIISPVTNYQKDHIRLCRPKGLSRHDAQQVIAYAIRKLGTEYDVKHVLDLARFLLPWSFMPRKFRSTLFEFNPGESTRTVCSSMIAEAFTSVEFPILPLVKTHATKGLELISRNPKLFSPRDFDYSPYFEIIKYPFVEFADYAMYRKLPWNREGLLSHDEVGIRPTRSRLDLTPDFREEIKTVIDPNQSLNTSNPILKKNKKESSRFKKLKERFGKHKNHDITSKPNGNNNPNSDNRESRDKQEHRDNRDDQDDSEHLNRELAAKKKGNEEKNEPLKERSD